MDNILIGKLFFALNNSKKIYSKHIEECANLIGLSKPEADLLLFFGNNPKYTNACDAVLHRKFSKAYVSKALSSLYKKKLILISLDKKDKRYQKIKLSSSSFPLLKKLQECQLNFFNSLKNGISKEDFNTFLKVIDKFTNNYLNQ